MNLTWTDERIETLKTEWAHGSTAEQIAGLLGGVTRDAVLGKAWRLGMSKPKNPALPPKPRVRKPLPVKVKAMPSWRSPLPPMLCEPVVDDETPAGLITFDELTEATCRFPYGDRDYLFCGKPPYGSMVYCANHCMRCFQPRG